MPPAPVAGAGVAGAAGGTAIATPSNIAVLSCATSWLVTASPTSALPAIATLVLPTGVHVVPFDDVQPETPEPLRASFSHAGAAAVPPARYAVAAPEAGRDMNS